MPYACPPPQVSANFRGLAPVETVTFASGRSRRVSRGTQAFYLDATFQWTFTYEEYEAFVAWWDADLAYGTLPTTVIAPWGDTAQEHSFVFTGKYSVTRDDFSMKVSAPVRITDFHTTIYTAFGDLYQTAPIEYPTEIPVPQMDVREKVAQLRTDIKGNAGGASSPLAFRGWTLDLSWSLSGLELDQFVVWFANCLRCGQRKFKSAIGPLPEMVYTVLEEPTISISGVDRKVSMTVQAVLPVTLPSSVIPMYVDTINASLDLYQDTVNNTLDQYVDTIGAT
jgi:hypothetical protein